MAHLITAKKEKSVWRFQIIREMCDKRQIGSVVRRRTNEHLFTQNVQRLNFIFLFMPFRFSYFRSVAHFFLSLFQNIKMRGNSTIKYKNYDSTILSFMRSFLVWHCVCVCVFVAPKKCAHIFMNHLLFSLWKENRRTLVRVYLNRTPWTDGCVVAAHLQKTT